MINDNVLLQDKAERAESPVPGAGRGVDQQATPLKQVLDTPIDEQMFFIWNYYFSWALVASNDELLIYSGRL